MEKKDIHTLKVLEEIDTNNNISQRMLAVNLDISLGLANSFIKRLVKKGFIKVTTIPKKRIMYLLTPIGAAEKTRLTYNYIKYSFKFYNDTRKKMILLFKNLTKDGVKRVSFYGVSEIAEIAYISLKETNIEFVAIADDEKVDDKFMGKKIISSGKLKNNDFDIIIITNIEQYRKNAEIEGIAKNKIIVFDG